MSFESKREFESEELFSGIGRHSGLPEISVCRSCSGNSVVDSPKDVKELGLT